jgi:hypothetical protein
MDLRDGVRALSEPSAALERVEDDDVELHLFLSMM